MKIHADAIPQRYSSNTYLYSNTHGRPVESSPVCGVVRCVGSLHPGTHVTRDPHVLEPKPYQLHSCHRARCHTQFKTRHQNQRWLPRHRKITTPHERGDEVTVGRGSSMYNVYLYIYCRFCLGGEGYIKPHQKREGWIFIPFFKDLKQAITM